MATTTLASWAVLVWQELESRGLDARKYFEKCGLDPSNMSEPGARYPTASMASLWQLCVSQTEDVGFGTAAGARWSPTCFHALGLAWLASSSLHDGLMRFHRYGRLIADALAIDIQDAGPIIYLNIEADHAAHPAAVDAAMAALVRMCRTLVGDNFVPLGVDLMRTQPEGMNALANYVQCPIHLGAVTNRVQFDRADVIRSLPTGNAVLSQANDAVALAYLSSLDASRWSVRVVKVIIDLLPAGKVTEEMSAQALHSSARNLQRKLADEGYSFGKLYEKVRQEKALEYLAISHLSLNEIAYLLGFSDPANFTRAFKRWYQLSPSGYRKSMQEKQSAALS